MSCDAVAHVLSIQVGLPRQLGSAQSLDPQEKPWTSGIFKQPISGPVAVGRCNLAGDGQADLVHHGGPDKAVLAYAAEHYSAWRSEWGIAELPYGAFGENLTVHGWAEPTVCIGDVWSVGDVRLQVSQPRQPCWKLGRRWQRPDLPKRVLQTGRSGWYLRVLQEGTIHSGLPVVLEKRVCPEWPVSRVARAMYDKQPDFQAVAALGKLEELAKAWRDEFARRSARAANG